MANIRPNRRRKRSPSSPSEASSAWKAIPLVLSAGFLLSLLLSASDEDPPSSLQAQGRRQLRLDESDAGYPDLPRDEERQGRRVLTVDVGLEENAWRRQLRARKDRERMERGRKGGGRSDGPFYDGTAAWSRMAAALEMDVAPNDAVSGGGDGGSSMRRMAVIPRYADKHHFEECVGKTIEECQVLVDSYVTSHTTEFNNQTTLMLDIRKIRELTDESYYKVVLRTNVPGTKVYGIFDTGEVFYPWPWRVNGQDVTIGPWSCVEDGNLLSPEACCTLIQDDVNYADDNNNFLACFVEEPVGGPHNPEREDRAIVATDGEGKVLRAPIAH